MTLTETILAGSNQHQTSYLGGSTFEWSAINGDEGRGGIGEEGGTDQTLRYDSICQRWVLKGAADELAEGIPRLPRH